VCFVWQVRLKNSLYLIYNVYQEYESEVPLENYLGCHSDRLCRPAVTTLGILITRLDNQVLLHNIKSILVSLCNKYFPFFIFSKTEIQSRCLYYIYLLSIFIWPILMSWSWKINIEQLFKLFCLVGIWVPSTKSHKCIDRLKHFISYSNHFIIKEWVLTSSDFKYFSPNRFFYYYKPKTMRAVNKPWPISAQLWKICLDFG
jgi:hypothetical protein